MTGRRVYPAPAKLNLMLRVVGRRSDGYHLLQTVFRLIDYGDDVAIAVRDDGVIRRVADIPGVPEEIDLTIRAARLLKEATGSPLGAEIGVTKRIPMGGGLGGGSSDAATVLIALNDAWGTRLTRRALMELGVKLGADVPVFVFGENALGEGIGEVLTPLPLPGAWYVVLTPSVAVSTAAIFGSPDLKRDSKPIKIQGFSAAVPANERVNDLEALVCRLYPEVAQNLEWLRGAVAGAGTALMTGSGSAVFGEFASEPQARSAFESRPQELHGFVAQGLDRHPLWGLVRS